MSKINATPPTPPFPEEPKPTSKTGSPHYEKGQIQAQPLTWLGMTFTGKEAEKLWSSIIQSIGNQITKDKEKAIENLRKNWGPDADDS